MDHTKEEIGGGGRAVRSPETLRAEAASKRQMAGLAGREAESLRPPIQRLMLRHALELETEAAALEAEANAVERANETARAASPLLAGK